MMTREKQAAARRLTETICKAIADFERDRGRPVSENDRVFIDHDVVTEALGRSAAIFCAVFETPGERIHAAHKTDKAFLDAAYMLELDKEHDEPLRRAA